MVKRVHLAATAAALLMGAAATGAHAADLTRPRTDFAGDGGAPLIAPAPHKSVQWDNKGRWGLRLDMNQPANRDPNWQDVQAGAFFRITPSMQVGGTVSVGNRFAQQQQLTPQDASPKVHLETAFRF